MWTSVISLLREDMGLKDIPASEILRLTGIKTTNANTLENGVGLYPLYPLMNSYCYCNTRYSIDKYSHVMEVRAQRTIKEGEEITTRYIVPVMGQPARMR